MYLITRQSEHSLCEVLAFDNYSEVMEYINNNATTYYIADFKVYKAKELELNFTEKMESEE